MKSRCIYSQICERFKCSILQYLVFEPMILYMIVVWVSFKPRCMSQLISSRWTQFPLKNYLCHELFIDMCKVSSQKA